MLELTAEQIGEYFKRSYTAVDGLWFMKVEARFDFETALHIDDEVWKVLPKIQARMLKSMGDFQGGLEALGECLTARLSLDGFVFREEKTSDGDSLKITISECPWHNVMIKSGREHLSARVGNRICNTEYAVWASEFGDEITFELEEQICDGAQCCILLFRVSK